MVAQRQELILASNNQTILWDEKSIQDEIRTLFAPTLSAMEFKLFMAIGKATGLNPYLKEIWAVKYGNNAAQVFIGRDGYRKGAQRQPSYEYHFADAVYENDDFSVDTGEVKHKYSLKDRGKLLGAYCLAKRKGAEKANYAFVELAEYSTGQSLWKHADAKGKPATMIKKVAEAQCLRSCWQEVFAGTYNEYEQFEQAIAVVEAPSGKGMGALEKALNIEPVEHLEQHEENPMLALSIQMNRLILENNVPEKSLEKWRKQFGVNSLEDVSLEGKEAIINHLLKVKEKS